MFQNSFNDRWRVWYSYAVYRKIFFLSFGAHCMATIITNIASLVNVRQENSLLRGSDLAHLPCIKNAYLVTEGAEIAAFGSMSELQKDVKSFTDHFDATGRMVLPSWCDSHTHLVFA